MRRPIIFVMLAGVAALVAALVVYSALKKREAQVEEALVKSVNIVVAAKDLPIGSKLDQSSFKLVRWAKDDMPPGAFTDSGSLVNQFTKTSFVQNEPIVGDRLFSGDKNAGVLPLLIPNGMRAVSVPVDEVSDIAGFVLPHARVDLLVSVANSQNGNQPFSKIVLQDVEVLAVAQEVENANADKPEVVRVVTLLVTPEQAERVNLASREGSLRMAMRNYEDRKIVATEGVDLPQLLRSYGSAPVTQPQVHAAPVAAIAPRPKPVEIEIMRNGKSVESVSFVHNRSASAAGSEIPANTSSGKPDKVASAPEGPSQSDPRHGAGLENGMTPAVTTGSILGSAAAPNGEKLAQLPAPAGPADIKEFSAPHSKTIDIP